MSNWCRPELYGVGQFTDLRMYGEALRLALSKGYLSIDILQKELPQRIKGLLLVQGVGTRAIVDLIREMQRFGFIRKVSTDKFNITEEGYEYANLDTTNPFLAKNILLRKTQEVFVTPAWFINRMWEWNPQGQGQIVIPTPIKEWTTAPRHWEDCEWTTELENVCQTTYYRIRQVLPGAFPVPIDKWLADIRHEYIREGKLKPRQKNLLGKKRAKYNPRARLSNVMKNVSVRIIFSKTDPLTKVDDFANVRSQMTHRSFMIWCPRLESFGLMFYTDYKPEIPGRLLFPTSSFKVQGDYKDYNEISYMINPMDKILYVHNPSWSSFKDVFRKTLYEVYEYFYNQQRIIYISLQDIRDEMCRQLRISPFLFESFLLNIYKSSLRKEIDYSISLETDLRQDMKVQVNRRGIYMNGVLYTLIAIKTYKI